MTARKLWSLAIWLAIGVACAASPWVSNSCRVIWQSLFAALCCLTASFDPFSDGMTRPEFGPVKAPNVAILPPQSPASDFPPRYRACVVSASRLLALLIRRHHQCDLTTPVGACSRQLGPLACIAIRGPDSTAAVSHGVCLRRPEAKTLRGLNHPGANHLLLHRLSSAYQIRPCWASSPARSHRVPDPVTATDRSAPAGRSFGRPTRRHEPPWSAERHTL
jgi:hypothetical protein